MRKLYGNATEAIGKGGDVREFEDYLPIEPAEGVGRFHDPYTAMQSAIYGHIAHRPDQDIPFDELAVVVADVDSNDVRNLAYGAIIALRNLQLIDFDSSAMVARKKG